MIIKTSQNLNAINKTNVSTNKNHINRNYTKPQIADSFIKTKKNPTFGANWLGEGWRQYKLRIQNRTSGEMEELGEIFHKYDDNNLKNIATIRHLFLRSIDDYQSKIAYEKLKKAVDKVKTIKIELENGITDLEILKGFGTSNIVKQKNRVDLEFLSLLKEEKNGNKVPITNGILVYGDSEKKEDFVKWITGNSGSLVYGFKHDKLNPMKTIDNIIDAANKAEITFKNSKTRTLLVIDDLDKMLTDESDDGIEMIGRFKSFVEHMSKDYHTTIITKTDRPLDDFEPASIGQHRFGIKVDLKKGITEEELKELETKKNEINRLNYQAEKSDDDYYGLIVAEDIELEPWGY